MKKVLIVLSAVLVLAGGLGFFVTRNPGSEGSSDPVENAMFTAASAASVPMSGAPVTQDSSKELGRESNTVVELAAPAGGSSGEVAADVALPPGGVGPRIIKTADLSIEVDKGGFDDAFGRADLIVGKYGGFVVSSSTWGEKSMSGNMLIRVPSKNFVLAKGELSKLGEIKSESTSGQEVTDQFIDLNARLRTWQAQAAVLLKLMGDAKSIAETMTVQRELQQVQFQIEQIKGQLRVLRDQTSFGTIAMEIHEPGAVTPTPGSDKPSLSVAWQRALAGFLSIVSLVIVGLGYLLPLSLLAGLAWFVVKRLTTRPAKAGAA